MRVLFLDIDGVMNTPDTCPTYDWTLKHPHHGIEPRFVERLNSICRRAEASIVLSSSWRLWLPRHGYDIEATLRAAGIEAPFVGVTDKLGTRADGKRGYEVAKWLKENPEVLQWVVLDDTDDFGNLPPERVTITDTHQGLTWPDADRVVLILQGKLEDAWPNGTGERSSA